MATALLWARVTPLDWPSEASMMSLRLVTSDGTLALAGRSRAIILLPPGGREGTDQHGELAVVEGAQRLEQPTAHRDLFPLLREARRGTAASL